MEPRTFLGIATVSLNLAQSLIYLVFISNVYHILASKDDSRNSNTRLM